MSADRTVVALATALAFAAGAVDALCFTALGHAFASVVTGNLVVAGLSLGRGDVAGAAPVALAVGGYVVGTGAGTALVGRPREHERWPRRATLTFAVELVPMLVLAALWWAAAGRPAGAAQPVCLGAAALAMGLQSAGFSAIGLSGVSTTYLTGTATGLVTGLVTERRVNGPALLALGGLVAGALTAGVLVDRAPPWAVAVPVVPLVTVVAVALRPAFRRRAAGGHPGRD